MQHRALESQLTDGAPSRPESQKLLKIINVKNKKLSSIQNRKNMCTLFDELPLCFLSEILESLDLEEIIKDFFKAKSRKNGSSSSL